MQSSTYAALQARRLAHAILRRLFGDARSVPALPLIALAATLAACSDGTGPTPVLRATVASVEYIGTRAALYIDDASGARSRVRFTGAHDQIPGNSPLVPPLTDDNLLALGSVAWSPDGSHLAAVATVAFDQSEIAIIHRDGRTPTIASPNAQIVLGDIDWSPDGGRLVYAMSTLPHALGVDLFITDLAANRVQRLTTGMNYRVIGGTLRFSTDGRSVYYARTVREGGAPLFEAVSEIRRLDLASGADTRVAGEIVGTIEAIARSGSWALAVRRNAAIPGGDFDRALVRVPLDGTSHGVLVPNGRLQSAALTSDDTRIVLVRDESTGGSARNVYLSLSALGGTPAPLPGTSTQTTVADAFFAR